MENFVGKLGIHLPLIPKLQHRIDDANLFSRAENLFLDHVVLPQPRGDLTPSPERGIIRQLANRRREISRATFSGEVLVY